jgi:flagellar basal-body rod protein FlgC
MGLLDALSISASGLSAERLRMDVTAENLANAQSTQGADGQPYRRKSVVLQAVGAGQGGFAQALAAAQGGNPAATGSSSGQTPGGVQVAAIVSDPTPGKQVYDPGHPDANAQGYVTMPNVDSVTEMVDLISESRAYEANTTAMQTAKQMFSKTLELLR